MAKKKCIECGKDGSSKVKDVKTGLMQLKISDKLIDNANDDDQLCLKCCEKLECRHALEMYNYNKSVLMPEEFDVMLKSGKSWIPIALAQLPTQDSSNDDVQIGALGNNNSTQNTSSTSTQSSDRITTANELERLSQLRHDEFKRQWQKNRTVQFKNDKIAILMRGQGAQVQFIVAYDQVTREGFRLMAIDEGKSVDGGAGFSGGISSYYYFQKINYVR